MQKQRVTTDKAHHGAADGAPKDRDNSPMQRWTVEWSSATGRGNVAAEYPDRLNRAEVIKRWESAHHGCYVERLLSRGPVEVSA